MFYYGGRGPRWVSGGAVFGSPFLWWCNRRPTWRRWPWNSLWFPEQFSRWSFFPLLPSESGKSSKNLFLTLFFQAAVSHLPIMGSCVAISISLNVWLSAEGFSHSFGSHEKQVPEACRVGGFQQIPLKMLRETVTILILPSRKEGFGGDPALALCGCCRAHRPSARLKNGMSV